MSNIKTILLILLLTLSTSVLAKKVKDVEIADTVTTSSNVSLTLNGAGIRTKFFFDIYIGALYLEQKTDQVDQVFRAGTNRVVMHILYKELSKEKLTKGWVSGFESNNSKEQFKSLQARLTEFSNLFTTVKKGDVIQIDYSKEIGTEVRINDELRGSVKGGDFNTALLKVWLGEDPADSGLKEAMLGK